MPAAFRASSMSVRRHRRAAAGLAVALLLAAAEATLALGSGAFDPSTAAERSPVPAASPSASVEPTTMATRPPSNTASPSSTSRPDPPVAPRVVHRVPGAGHVVALTFDDGWSAANGRRILAELQAAGVPATFFINGMYVDRSPDLWREVVAAGYPVGDHGYHHRDLTTMDADAVVDELRSTDAAFRRVTGVPMIPAMRPPYGARTGETDAAAAVAGFPDVVLWDTVSGDTSRQSDAQVIRNATAGRDGSIVLMHVGPDVTPRVLPAIIASYRARGFRFVTIPDLLPARTTPAIAPSALPADASPEASPAVLPVPSGDAPAASTRPTPSIGPSIGPSPAPSPMPTSPAWEPAVVWCPGARTTGARRSPGYPSPGRRDRRRGRSSAGHRRIDAERPAGA